MLIKVRGGVHGDAIDTKLHENAIISLFREQFLLQQGVNTASGCGIGRCGRF